MTDFQAGTKHAEENNCSKQERGLDPHKDNTIQKCLITNIDDYKM